MKNIVIRAATLTAVGSLNRSLKNVQGYELGSAVIKESIICFEKELRNNSLRV